MKKILVILAVSLILMAGAVAKQEVYTGTTTQAWVANKIPVADWEDITVAINNTGADSTMYYKIDGYVVYGGTASEALVDSTALTASTSVVPLKISNTAYGEIRVSVISGTTAYTIEVIKK